MTRMTSITIVTSAAVVGMLAVSAIWSGSLAHADQGAGSRVAILECTLDFAPPNRTKVITYDGSTGSPAIIVGAPCSEAMALLIDDGFVIADIDEGDDAVQFVGYLLVDSAGLSGLRR